MTNPTVYRIAVCVFVVRQLRISGPNNWENSKTFPDIAIFLL